MKNLRKTVCLILSLMLVLVVSGCGTATNYPGAATGNTGNAAIGTGTGIVPGTSAITGTNTSMNARTYGTNLGTNLGTNVRRNMGTNLGTNTTGYPGTTNLGNVGYPAYRDGIYTASSPNGTETATVTVSGGKITQVIINGARGNTGLRTTQDDIARRVLSAQHANITINGANMSTNNMISAVRRALDKARA